MKTMHLAPGIWIACAIGGAAAADFESPPDQAPAAIVPASLLDSTTYRILDPVHSDGLMQHFEIDSVHGRYEAYGLIGLSLRVGELRALDRLAKTSDIAVVTDSVGRGLTSQVDTVAHVVTNPLGTVVGIPKGIAHLFHGYVDRGKEAVDKAERTAAATTAPSGGDGAGARRTVDRGAAEAKRYAAQYLGVTASERRWYEKLGVDPYTNNTLLRASIHKKARLEAATGVGMRFVGLPGIPEIGEVQRAMDAIYREDPATLRAQDRKTLRDFGLDSAEIERWQDAIVLSPTRQRILMEAAKSLVGVDGRGELFRHALGLTSDVEAQVYLGSVELLVHAHALAPLAQILPGLRLPAARTAAGGVIVCGAFDAVYWTAEVDAGEAELRAALASADGAPRELWLAGRASPRAGSELRARGWTLREDQRAAESVTPVR
jgi:hypothetical protein